MSGAVKSVTKVFKKVTKSTVGKFIVAAAVSYFTAGLGASVLGATSFGATLSPTMATVLSHAISGSIAGGITSAVSGGGIGKGLLLGAAGGAVMGGVQSAMGNYTAIPGATPTAPTAGAPTGAAGTAAPSASAGATAPGAVGAPPTTPASAAMPPVQNAGFVSPPPGVNSAVNIGPGGTPVAYMANGVNSATIPAGQSVMTPAGMVQGTGRTGLMGWVDSHPELTGNMISGAAKGAIELAAGGGQGGGTDYAAATEKRIAAEQADQLRIQGSHSGTGGLMTASSVPQQKGGMAPSQRWNTPDSAYSNGRWQYDQASGRVVFVPNTPSPSAA